MNSLKLDKSGLDRLVQRFENPQIKAKLENIMNDKGVIAIIAQAIADNFDKEGPGWAPLKAETIRQSVKKRALKQQLKNMTDEEILRHESRARKQGTHESFIGPNRRILRQTGLLMKTVTTPIPGGSFSKGKMSGRNIFKTDGTHLMWGTDLVYAGVHNNGDASRNIPKREFLVLRSEWLKQLNDYILKEAMAIISEGVLT